MRCLFVLLGLVSHSIAMAGAFDDAQISGPCSKKNMDIIENGDTLSILLHDFGANMPEGEKGDGKLMMKDCSFGVRITFPKDQYLASLRQVFSGGIIKSEKASGQLIVVSKILMEQPMREPLRWKKGEAITPESDNSIFDITLEETLKKPAVCLGRVNYRTRLTLQAQRPTEKDHFIAAVDSIDSEFMQRVDLVPEWQPCVGPLRAKPKMPDRPRRHGRGPGRGPGRGGDRR